MARFVSQDPLGMAGSGVDLYQYAGSDPANLIDPTGLESWWESGINGFTGGVDALTGGATSGIRSALGLAQPNASSAAYQAGTFVGIAVAVVVPGDEEAAAADVGAHAAAEVPTIAEDSVAHIFRDAPGHLATDTSENRALIENSVQPENYIRTGGGGEKLYRETLADGTQAWAKVFNGSITNGGVNQTPLP